MKAALLILFLANACYSTAQRPAFKFELAAGPGINQKLVLHNEPVSKAGGTVLLFGSALRVKLLNRPGYFYEVGLYGKYVYNKAGVDLINFQSHTLRSAVTFMLAYGSTGKWGIAFGTSFQNNRDYNDIFVNQAYNFRFDGVLRMQYELAPKLDLTLRYCQSISRLGDPYFINDPEFSVLTGISYTLERKSD